MQIYVENKLTFSLVSYWMNVSSKVSWLWTATSRTPATPPSSASATTHRAPKTSSWGSCPTPQSRGSPTGSSSSSENCFKRTLTRRSTRKSSSRTSKRTGFDSNSGRSCRRERLDAFTRCQFVIFILPLRFGLENCPWCRKTRLSMLLAPVACWKKYLL